MPDTVIPFSSKNFAIYNVSSAYVIPLSCIFLKSTILFAAIVIITSISSFNVSNILILLSFLNPLSTLDA